MRNPLRTWATAAVLVVAALTGCGGGGGAAPGGSETTSVAPAIVTQPAAAGVVAPSAATFSVVATGTPAPAYQWERSTDNGATYTSVTGATASTYTTPATAPADGGTLFRVNVSNSAGSVRSSAAALAVAPASVAPLITTQPIDTAVTAPAPATFSVTATASPSPTYQWQLSSDGGANYADIAGAVAPTYTLATTSASDDGHRFRVRIANTAGSVTSNAAMLSVGSAGSGLVVVHTFAGTDGGRPINQLVEGSDGNFYGATLSGGASNFGTLFRMTPAGVVTTLHSFDATSGGPPRSALVQGPDGAFYGSVTNGGANAMGYVFRLQLDGSFSALHAFNGTDGMSPIGALAVGSDGNLYGVTQYGGTGNLGTVYRISPGGVFASLHSFVSSTTSGYGPQAGLLLGPDGAFYGTTASGGDQSAPHSGSGSVAGTVFRMTSAGAMTLLHTFFSGGTSTDWGVPNTALVQAGDGTLYGSTAQGNLFRIRPDGSGYGAVTTSLLTGGLMGQLVSASDGNLYFASHDGTPTGQYGKVYSVTPTGTIRVVLGFDSAGAYLPDAPLMQARSGSLYGTTRYCAGAPNSACRTGSAGTVFRLDLGLPPQ